MNTKMYLVIEFDASESDRVQKALKDANIKTVDGVPKAYVVENTLYSETPWAVEVFVDGESLTQRCIDEL